MSRRDRLARLRHTLPALCALLALAGATEAAARCDDAQRRTATDLLEQAHGVDDALDRAILLKRSLQVCQSVRGWFELGEAELELDNPAEAAYAFENARDRLVPDADGRLGPAEVEQRALADAWLAESYRREGELALAVVAVQEARRGFEAIGRPLPERLLRLQAELDDALASADAAVLARSFELQHERTTRGIGVRPRLRETPDAPAQIAETAALREGYTGTAEATAAATPPPEPPPAPTSDTSPTSPTESRLDIPVLFAFDSAALAPESERTVERLAEALARLDLGPSDRVRVVGHTDAQGAAAYNLALSERRATAVLERLRDLGVTGAALEAVGRGESELRYAGTTAADHRRNRRVELVIVR